MCIIWICFFLSFSFIFSLSRRPVVHENGRRLALVHLNFIFVFVLWVSFFISSVFLDNFCYGWMLNFVVVDNFHNLVCLIFIYVLNRACYTEIDGVVEVAARSEWMVFLLLKAFYSNVIKILSSFVSFQRISILHVELVTRIHKKPPSSHIINIIMNHLTITIITHQSSTQLKIL